MFFAALCVALMAMLTGQVAIAAVDRVHHGAGIDHAANPVAGDVVVHGDDHGPGQQHHPQTAPVGDDDDGAPGAAHHHHGDGPQTPALLAEAAMAALQGRSHLPPTGARAPRPRPMNFGLERPPRRSLETFA